MAAPDLESGHEPRLVFVVTDSITARFLLRGQLEFLARSGFEVSLICSPGPHLNEVRAREGTRCYEIPMQREIHLWHDLRSLFGLVRLLRRLRPDIVSASTPKAGLLGMLAAFLARVPCRVNTIRGLRLETTGGWKRIVLQLAERISSACAHRVVCVSDSLRDEVLRRKLAASGKVLVLGPGSSNGVDLSSFHPGDPRATAQLRRQLELAPDVPVIGFVGRLTRDKGIDDLVRAFETVVLARVPAARLLVLGDYEAGDPASKATRSFLDRRSEAIMAGFVEDTAPWYRVMTVVAFPSYREGFPNVPLEAAATGLPVVGYDATGTRDAVVEDTTGSLVPAGDWRALGRVLCEYLTDREQRRSRGEAGRQRVRDLFSREAVWDRWRAFYAEVMLQSARQARRVAE